MDAEDLKHALNEADTDISDMLNIFSVPPQQGAKVSEEDYQQALHSILKNEKINNKDELLRRILYEPDTGTAKK